MSGFKNSEQLSMKTEMKTAWLMNINYMISFLVLHLNMLFIVTSYSFFPFACQPSYILLSKYILRNKFQFNNFPKM